MKESHIEGVAIHDDPESCAVGRKAGREALTGACAGAVLSRENRLSRAPTPLTEAEGDMIPARYRERMDSPARWKTRNTCRTFACENQETPVLLADDGAAGRAEKASGLTSAMNGAGKSDRLIVPTKSPNKAARAAAEVAEEGVWSRATRRSKTRSGLRAGLACPVRSAVCVKERKEIKTNGSLRCSTTWTSTGSGLRSCP